MNDDNSIIPVPSFTWILPAVVHGVLALTVFTRLLVSGPGYSHMFDDFKMTIPLSTEGFVALSDKIESQPVSYLGLLLLLWASDAFALWLLGGWARFEGQLWFWVVVVLLLLTWGLMEVSFLLPYLKLKEALSR